MAEDLQSRIQKGEFESRADMARLLGYSRARITQIFCLLNLSPEASEILKSMGDFWPHPVVTERTLRSLIRLSTNEQIVFVTGLAGQMKLLPFKDRTGLP